MSVRDDPFWKDNHIYCDKCGGSLDYCCRCPGGPRGQTSPETDDEHTENDLKITETINSMDYATGYQYSATGTGITANGNLSPGTGSNNVTIDGVTSTWTGVTTKPSFTQTTPGAAFQFTETYSGLV